LGSLDVGSLHLLCPAIGVKYWALVTVWVVARLTPGMMLSKSIYLAIGTAAGAVFGIGLIALFLRTPRNFSFWAWRCSSAHARSHLIF
jgi:uncharacterized membrane protein YccC